MTAKEKLVKIVESAHSDDLERAQSAFRGMTQKQLDQEHGFSGKTRREILEEYAKARRDWEAAYDLAKNCPDRA